MEAQSTIQPNAGNDRGRWSRLAASVLRRLGLIGSRTGSKTAGEQPQPAAAATLSDSCGEIAENSLRPALAGAAADSTDVGTQRVGDPVVSPLDLQPFAALVMVGSPDMTAVQNSIRSLQNLKSAAADCVVECTNLDVNNPAQVRSPNL